MTDRTKWLGVSGLIVVWLALGYVYVIDVPPPQEVPLKFTSGRAAVDPIRKPPTENWEVKSLHAPVRELPATPKKNIFTAAALLPSPEAQAKRMAQRAHRKALVVAAEVQAAPSAPYTPPPPSPEELARQQEELVVQQAKQQEELRRKQLQEQMAQYRYLGYVSQNGVSKAFLGKGKEIYIMRQGDTLDGKFLVAAIEAATVKLQTADAALETIIKLKKEENTLSGT
ncbi:MAG: hypothetical protein ABL970_03070 [Nitrospira sp.]